MNDHRQDALATLDRAAELHPESAVERQVALTEALVYALFDVADAIRGRVAAGSRSSAPALWCPGPDWSKSREGAEEPGESSTDPFSEAVESLRKRFGL